jgi:hypothetical protein
MTWGIARVSGDVKGVRTADTTPTCIELGPDQQGSNIAGPGGGQQFGLCARNEAFLLAFLVVEAWDQALGQGLPD